MRSGGWGGRAAGRERLGKIIIKLSIYTQHDSVTPGASALEAQRVSEKTTKMTHAQLHEFIRTAPKGSLMMQVGARDHSRDHDMGQLAIQYHWQVSPSAQDPVWCPQSKPDRCTHEQAILLEPIPWLAERLERKYADNPLVHVVRATICPSAPASCTPGVLPFSWVQTSRKQVSSAYRPLHLRTRPEALNDVHACAAAPRESHSGSAMLASLGV